MHWNSAKLQVNALALRGLSPRQAHLISDERRNFANLAIVHAMNTLSLVLEEDPSIHSSIQGVPLYFHTTVAYASLFLLRAQMRWRPARLNINIPMVLALIERVVTVLSQVDVSERHLSCHVSTGLVKFLDRYRKSKHAELDTQSPNHFGCYAPIVSTGSECWVANVSDSDTVFGDMDMYNTFDNQLLPPTFCDRISQQIGG